MAYASTSSGGGGGGGAAAGFLMASAGLDIIGGLFGYFASQEAAAIAESRGRMFRMEAEIDATRYAEQAQGFKAAQKLGYLKAGVALTGSPLDILDETARVAAENISAIRARGAAGELGAQEQATQARISGRTGLISGIAGGIGKIGSAVYQSKK